MMKKSLVITSFILVLSLSLISAGWFSDIFSGKVTGNVIVESDCVNGTVFSSGECVPEWTLIYDSLVSKDSKGREGLQAKDPEGEYNRGVIDVPEVCLEENGGCELKQIIAGELSVNEAEVIYNYSQNSEGVWNSNYVSGDDDKADLKRAGTNGDKNSQGIMRAIRCNGDLCLKFHDDSYSSNSGENYTREISESQWVLKDRRESYGMRIFVRALKNYVPESSETGTTSEVCNPVCGEGLKCQNGVCVHDNEYCNENDYSNCNLEAGDECIDNKCVSSSKQRDSALIFSSALDVENNENYDNKKVMKSQEYFPVEVPDECIDATCFIVQEILDSDGELLEELSYTYKQSSEDGNWKSVMQEKDESQRSGFNGETTSDNIIKNFYNDDDPSMRLTLRDDFAAGTSGETSSRFWTVIDRRASKDMNLYVYSWNEGEQKIVYSIDCVDSEKGIESIWSKGTLNIEGAVFEDSCVEGLNVVNETSCGKYKPVFNAYACPGECVDGACVLPKGQSENDLTCPSVVEGGPRIDVKTRLVVESSLKYCNPKTLEFEAVKRDSESCEGDYECNSGACVDNQCTSIGEELTRQGAVLDLIVCYLEAIFYKDKTMEQCKSNYQGELDSFLCSSTDGGKNYLVKGSTSGIDLLTGIEITKEDVCASDDEPDFLVEYSCNGKNVIAETYDCSLAEKTCGNGACVQAPSRVQCNLFYAEYEDRLEESGEYTILDGDYEGIDLDGDGRYNYGDLVLIGNLDEAECEAHLSQMYR